MALYELAARHRLGAGAVCALRQLAGLEREPPQLQAYLPRAVAILGAALAGLGIIFWIAANWALFGRFGRFALLEGIFVLMCGTALWRPVWRAPLTLLAMLCIGGFFACFGQSYQSGADPWQLFALWSALALPLCLGVRSDVLWMPWSLLVISAVSLWVRAYSGGQWSVSADDLPAHALAWGAALALAFGLGPRLRRFSGAGPWSFRTALLLLLGMVTATALAALFQQSLAPQYALALVVLSGGVGVLAQPRYFDMFGMCAGALGLNILLDAGFAQAVLSGYNSNYYGGLLVISCVTATLLAVTVYAILQAKAWHGRAGDE